LGATEHRGEAPLDVDGGASPQLGCLCVVQDGADVVVTVRAKRCADELVSGSVKLHASEHSPMRARRLPDGSRMTSAVCSEAMNGAEPRGCQRDEDGRMAGD
jgi:hypothetical protein